MMVGAQGAYYTDQHGKKIFDGLSGLWCAGLGHGCLLYTSDAADERSSVDLGGRRIIKKKHLRDRTRVVVIHTSTRTETTLETDK